MGIKLNAEQQKIAAENLNLISFMLKKYGINEDYYDLGMECLCKAAYYWDPSKGTLSTIFQRIFFQKLHEEWSNDDKFGLYYKAGYQLCNLQSPTNRLEDGYETIEDLIEDEEPGFDSVRTLQIYKQFKSMQKKRDQELLSELEKGLTVGQIAKKQGISKQAVSRRKMGLQYKFHMCYLKDNPEFKDKMTYGVYK